ncbi:MAG TPA: ABC transporter permease [Verrucomicrobiae bacterium]|nr:ABC transporter permease [Verrucomicrobiae bacterium]
MSRLPFELFLALRYLRPKRTFVSIITLISIVGVALGVAVLVIVMSVMSGFDRDLRQKILGFNPHLTVMQWNPSGSSVQPMENYQDIGSLISSNRNVRAVSPIIMGPVLIETQPKTDGGSKYEDAPMLRGVDPAKESKITQLPDSIVAGKFDLSGRSVLVGVDFAENLHLQVGDIISIYSPAELKKMHDTQGKNGETTILPDDYTVTGIFDTGYYEFNSRWIITSLDNAQDLYALDDKVQGLVVALNDPYRADAVKEQLQAMLGDEYSIQSWMDRNSEILSAIAVEKNVMFFLLFFVVLVAALCILSAQITFVVQKTREIGMLKALGATNFQIMGLFLSQSAVIGVIGVLSGYGLGMLMIAYRNPFLHFLRAATGIEIFPAKIYGFFELPAQIIPGDIIIICISSFIICILGGVIPAFRAGRLKPVEALRYE